MFKRIFVPVDGSETSLQAVRLACRLAAESGGELRLAHVLDRGAYLTGYDVGGASGALYEALQSSATSILAEAHAEATDAGARADTVLVNEMGSSLGEAVASAASAWKADLIVVGTHGRRGPSRLLLGSGADQVIRLAPVPVLVSRSPASE